MVYLPPWACSFKKTLYNSSNSLASDSLPFSHPALNLSVLPRKLAAFYESVPGNNNAYLLSPYHGTLVVGACVLPGLIATQHTPRHQIDKKISQKQQTPGLILSLHDVNRPGPPQLSSILPPVRTPLTITLRTLATKQVVKKETPHRALHDAHIAASTLVWCP